MVIMLTISALFIYTLTKIKNDLMTKYPIVKCLGDDGIIKEDYQGDLEYMKTYAFKEFEINYELEQ